MEKKIYESAFIERMRDNMLGESGQKTKNVENQLEEALSPQQKQALMAMMLDVMENGGEELYQEVAKIVRQQQTGGAKKIAPKPAIVNNGNPIEVGDIFNDYFSYTMTFNRFYQVTGVKGKTLTVRPIESRLVSGDHFTGQVSPVPNAFAGGETTIKIRGNFQNKTDVSVKSGRGRIYYVQPKQDGTYPSFYENHLD